MQRDVLKALSLVLMCTLIVVQFSSLANAESHIMSEERELIRNRAIKRVRSLVLLSEYDLALGKKTLVTAMNKEISTTDRQIPRTLPTVIDPSPLTLSCSKSGELMFDTLMTANGAWPLALNLQNEVALTECNGYDGTLALESNALFGEAQINIAHHLVGSQQGTCADTQPLTIDYDVSVEGGWSTSTAAPRAFLTGEITAQCGRFQLLTCSWTNIPLLDKAQVYAGCH